MLQESAHLRAEQQEDLLTVQILGEIDHHSARPIREELDKLLYLCRPKKLNLDLENVSFMDSSGLGLLMGRITLAESLCCRVCITNANRRIQRILHLAGLKRINNLVIEEDGALTNGKNADGLKKSFANRPTKSRAR